MKASRIYTLALLSGLLLLFVWDRVSDRRNRPVDSPAPYSVSQEATRSTDTARNLSAPEPGAASPITNPTASGVPDSGGSADLEDFERRCQAPGVLLCKGFDSPSDFVRAVWPASGPYPAWDGAMRGTLDTQVKASGNGSLRFEIPSYSGPNTAGYCRQAMGRSFGEGATFYVQFRQRFSPEMLTNQWGGTTTWKQTIFHNARATCADVELATGNYYRAGFPVMNTDCGARGLSTNNGIPPYLHQQGDYNCPYGSTSPAHCFFYPANQWVTFYYQVSIGHWGRPDSTIKAWVALPGKPYKQWINMTNFVLNNSAPGNDYDTVTLLPYMTGKDLKIYGGPTAYTWYEELIISTRPIAAAGTSVGR